MSLNRRLEDALEGLAAYPRADESEYTPRTEFDHQAGGYIQTGPLKSAPTDYDDLLRQFGYDPAEVCIVGHPRVSRWQQRARIRGTAEYETSWLSAYKFQIAPRDTNAATDLDGIIAAARKKPAAGTGPHVFVFQASDLQCGKVGKTPDGGHQHHTSRNGISRQSNPLSRNSSASKSLASKQYRYPCPVTSSKDRKVRTKRTSGF